VVEALPVPKPIAAFIRGKWKTGMGDIKGKALGEARQAAFETGDANAAAQACASIYDQVQATIATRGVSESDFADMICANGLEGIDYPANLWTKPAHYPAILNIAKALK